MSITFEINKELNGIEIKFSEKPTSEVLAKMKALGFRWNPKKCVWYAKDTEERRQFAESIKETTVYEQISLFPTVAEEPGTKEEPKVDKPKEEPKKNTTSKDLPKDKDLSIEEIASKARKVKPKDDNKIIEFAKARPKVQVRFTDGNATYEECVEKVKKEKDIYKDSSSHYVLEGLLKMCEVNQNFRNNFMREDKSYGGAFTYFSNLARQGYAHKVNGVSYMDDDLALGMAMDYYNSID